MLNRIIGSTTLFAMIVITAAFAPHTSARNTSDGETYFRCPSSYVFETSGSAAHCKKPEWTETKALAGCVIGLYPSVDRVGTKDMCAGTNPLTGEVSVEQQCNPADVTNGFSKRIVAGKDFCAKTHPAEYIAPNVAITI
jgi:hypothetical protein